MGDKEKCGLVHGDDTHHLDHIAPLCHLLDMPLVVTNRRMERLVWKYYPGVKVNSSFDYSIVYSCLPRPLLKPLFFPKELPPTVWVPHGNSDKGGFTGLSQEQKVLVYGKKMKEEIQCSGIEVDMVEIGNYRHLYYIDMQSYYRELVKPQKKRLILFAPSWNEPKTFFSSLPNLVKRLGNTHSLLVKPHPNLIRQSPLEYELAKDRYESDDVIFLTDFLPIYPLLDIADVYVGDTSSIGYDMLAFEKPMFFINKKKVSLDLHKVGRLLQDGEYDPIFLPMKPPVEKIREMYTYTFGGEE